MDIPNARSAGSHFIELTLKDNFNDIMGISDFISNQKPHIIYHFLCELGSSLEAHFESLRDDFGYKEMKISNDITMNILKELPVDDEIE